MICDPASVASMQGSPVRRLEHGPHFDLLFVHPKIAKTRRVASAMVP